MNAVRIWIYYREGIVRIKVPPDREIRLNSGGKTEEGYKCVTETYFLTYDGTLCYSLEREEMDCDGYHWERRSFVAVGNAKTNVEPMNGISRDGIIVPLVEKGPIWRRI